jgi:hypothetical protein
MSRHINKNIRRRGLVILASLVLIAIGLVPAYGTTYYVKNGGNDNLDGLSDATAWATIGKVNSYIFATGDDVYFKCGGTWTGTGLIIDWEGTVVNRVVIGAYYMDDNTETIGVSHNKPILDRGDSGTGISIAGEDYVTLQNLDVRKGNNSIVINASISSVNYPIIEDCDVGSGTTAYGIRIYTGYETTGGLIRRNVVDSKVGTYGQDESTLVDGIKLSTATYYKVYNNTLRDWAHTAMRIPDSKHCEIYDNYIECVDLQATITSSGRAFGFSGTAFRNEVYRNYCKNMRTQSQLLGGTYNSIYYNIFDNMMLANSYGGSIWAITGNGDYCAYNKFYNNVMYSSYGSGTSTATIRMYSGDGFYDCEYNEIKNNIILEPQNGRAIYVVNYAAHKNNTFANNIIYKTGDTSIISYRGSDNLTVSQWESAASNGDIITGNMAVDPGLASPTSGQFWPDELSDPIVDAGINLGDDYDNGLNPSSSWPDNISTLDQDNYGTGWEIGAYVYKEAAIEEAQIGLPKSYSLLQNYPNPFSNLTAISYELPVKIKVSLRIYDINGKLVTTLFSKEMNAGLHSAKWNTEGIAPGIYFANLKAGEFIASRKMIVLGK